MTHDHMKLENTALRRKESFKPLKDNEVRIYSCGPTVYDFAHIGNFRAYLFGDLLYRFLTHFKQYKVKWVMNITDIDDKTIKASEAPGDPKENLKTFTRKFEKEFLKDLETLQIFQKQFMKMPRATEHIGEIQKLIKKILKNGFAYIKDGSIYFDVMKYATKHTYGQLINIDLEGFQSGVRIDADEYSKENLKDFTLWKAKKENEPSWDFKIDNVNYEGRPGWHIECSAMSNTYLGKRFDIHTGGIDLKFPHHENEIAQSIAGYGENPVHFWCHNEHLLVENKKMSKSLGNFYTLRDLEKKEIEPKYFRFLILSTHYRKKFNFTFEGIEGAKTAVQRIQELIYKLLEIQTENNENREQLIKNAEKDFEKALDDDLNTPNALGKVFDLMKEINILLAQNKIGEKAADRIIDFFKKINNIFAIFSFEKETLENDIEKNIQERNEARASKDFEKADKIRDELHRKGIELEDTPGRTLWRKR